MQDHGYLEGRFWVRIEEAEESGHWFQGMGYPEKEHHPQWESEKALWRRQLCSRLDSEAKGRFRLMEMGDRLQVPGTSDMDLTSVCIDHWACRQRLQYFYIQRQWPEQAWPCPNLGWLTLHRVLRMFLNLWNGHDNLPWTLLGALSEVGVKQPLTKTGPTTDE